MKKYFTALFSLVRLIFYKFIFCKNVDFHFLQSHSIFSVITINRLAKLILKKNIQLSPGCEIFLANGSRVEIGERTYFNKRCIISSHKHIFIGDNCLFGPDVKIYDNNHVFMIDIGVVHGKHNSESIIIGNNCWFAANVVVLSGTSIGDNCIVSAGAIVKGKIPANSIVKPDVVNKIIQIK